MKTLIIILVLAFTANAQQPPEDWKFLTQGSSADGVVNTFIDLNSIVRGDDKVKVWTRFSVVYGYPFRDAKRNYLPLAKELEIEMMLDCKAKTVKNGKGFVYDAAGNMILEYKWRDTAKEKPGTLSWLVFEYFCEKEGKQLTAPPVLKLAPTQRAGSQPK